VREAARKGIKNFSLLVSHVLVPPVMEALLSSPGCRVQGFLAAGHVCAVMGCEEYLPVAARYHVPIVVTGFEPLDILQGILMCVSQLESGRAEVENQYIRAVRHTGNQAAQQLVREVFRIVARKWRGLGEIPQSGLGFTEEYAAFDAAVKFEQSHRQVPEPAECRSGLILQGKIKPSACPVFGNRCTPEHPLGALMVSSEGACAAYYRYRSHNQAKSTETL
jgi:hydrogenase expression/formation protein HypD